MTNWAGMMKAMTQNIPQPNSLDSTATQLAEAPNPIALISDSRTSPLPHGTPFDAPYALIRAHIHARILLRYGHEF